MYLSLSSLDRPPLQLVMNCRKFSWARLSWGQTSMSSHFGVSNMNLLLSSHVLTTSASMRKVFKEQWKCYRKIYSLLKFEWVKTFNERAMWSSSNLSVGALHFECREEPSLIFKAFDCAKDRQTCGQAVATFQTAFWNNSHHSLNHFTGPKMKP